MRQDFFRWGLVLALLLPGAARAQNPAASTKASAPSMFQLTFISDNPPFPASHASTIVETRDGVMASWFGGTRERHPDVSIWTSRFKRGKWSDPVKVADGLQEDGTTRHPSWNPVLFRPEAGPLLLFYKVGPSPSEWWGMLKTSVDNGKTWSPAKRLPEGQVGPVRNKPVAWPDGSLLCPSSSEDDGWRIHMERTPDLGATWERTGPLNDKAEFGAIQPTIFQWRSGAVQILNRSRNGAITECWMGDDWKHWSPMKKTSLPNPNSAIDGLVLKDGRGLLVFNDAAKARTPISLALSKDGKIWKSAAVIEDIPGAELSYPAVIQAGDGHVHITYTWKREKIRHVVFDPATLD